MASYVQNSLSNFVNLNNLFFSVENHVLKGTTIEVYFEPEEFITIFTEDRGLASYVKRSMNNAKVIFDVEVYQGTYAYNVIWNLAYNQAFVDKAPEEEFLKVVYNDGMQFKVVTNYAVFTNIPRRKPTYDMDKISFTIQSGIFTVSTPQLIKPIISDLSRL